MMTMMVVEKRNQLNEEEKKRPGSEVLRSYEQFTSFDQDDRSLRGELTDENEIGT